MGDNECYLESQANRNLDMELQHLNEMQPLLMLLIKTMLFLLCHVKMSFVKRLYFSEAVAACQKGG